jgi:HEAT repeat protein
MATPDELPDTLRDPAPPPGFGVPPNAPKALSYSAVGLPNFSGVSVWWFLDRLVYSRRASREAPEEEPQERSPTFEEWEAFWAIVDGLRAWEWKRSYEARACDGLYYSVKIARGGRSVHVSGENAGPPGLAVFRRALLGLVEGTLLGSAPELLRAAKAAAIAYDEPSVAVRRLAETIASVFTTAELNAAAEALGAFGLRAMEALPALVSQAWIAPYAARDALHELVRAAEQGPHSELLRFALPVLPHIVRALHARHGTEDVREDLTRLLRCIGPVDASVVPALAAALGDPDGGVLKAAARALGWIGAPAAAAAPALLAPLRERLSTYGAAEELVRALAGIAPEHLPAAVTILIPALDDASSEVRRNAAEGLAKAGPAAAGAVGRLVELLGSPDRDLRWRAAEALCRIGPAARAAEPALVAALREGEWTVHWRAAAALGEMRAESLEAAEALVEALAHDDHRLRTEAARALCAMAPQPSLVPRLVALAQQNERCREAADQVLAHIGTAVRGGRPDDPRA